MLPLKPPAFGKSIFVVQQKLLFCFVFGLLVIAFIGCNSSNSENAVTSNDSTANSGAAANQITESTGSNVAKAAGLNATFHDLYLTKNEFNTIITEFRPNPYKKFVFQFFFPEDALEGSPTLALWPSKKNNSAFPEKPQQILHYARTSYTNLPKSLYLGDLQTDVSPLKTAIDTSSNCDNKCVLFFVLANSATLSYDIYLVKDSTTIINQSINALDFKSLTPIGQANPSPPAIAN